jgi:SAM-dependent methyltransferase
VSESSLRAGADRFRGYSDLYDAVRPLPPPELAELLVAYCGRQPDLVVDLGSGTGLSTRWASGWSREVIGVEPSDDMRVTAQRLSDSTVSYRGGWSHDTGLPDHCADVVLVVQALHWMEPTATFGEVARLLRPGGVFAAVDCDWPPVVGDHASESAWDTCRSRIRVFETRLAAGMTGAALLRPVADDDDEAAMYSGMDAHQNRCLAEGVRSWAKSGHLQRMAESRRFQWCREVALGSHEFGDSERFIGLLKSQGDYQTLVRHGLDDDTLGVDRFAALVRQRLRAEPRSWLFVYRARLGFTP